MSWEGGRSRAHAGCGTCAKQGSSVAGARTKPFFRILNC